MPTVSFEERSPVLRRMETSGPHGHSRPFHQSVTTPRNLSRQAPVGGACEQGQLALTAPWPLLCSTPGTSSGMLWLALRLMDNGCSDADGNFAALTARPPFSPTQSPTLPHGPVEPPKAREDRPWRPSQGARTAAAPREGDVSPAPQPRGCSGDPSSTAWLTPAVLSACSWRPG